MTRLLTSLVLAWSPFATGAALHVLLDPGHGGKDHGVVRGSVREAQVALSVSRKLAELLEQDSRFKTSFTRTHDEFVSLSRRTEIAQDLKADVMISIHANSNEEARVRGPEFYFQSVMPTDEYAQFLANRENTEIGEVTETKVTEDAGLSAKDDITHILTDLKRNYRVKLSAELVKSLHQSWYPEGHHLHTIKQAPFYVISQTNAPSALIELGYVTNPQEAQMLSQESQQKVMANRMYEALIRFKNKLDKQ